LKMSEKILIVDDDIDSLKLIGLMLQRHGYEVVAANAGNQALSKATSEHPSLIILDVMMPDMDGYEVCRRLRANPDTRSIPIIMFTAKTLVDDKVAGFEAGADDYLTKPTHPAELASRVKSILARSAPPTNQRRPETVNKGLAVGVIGAKGGVGTTTIALNIPAALIMSGENPIVADFRLGSGSLGLSIGLGSSYGMANILGKPANEIRPPVIEGELAVHQSGLRTLLSSTRVKEAQLNFSVDSALAVVRSLRTMGRPAFFDLGSSLTASVSRLQREMDQIIVVVEPSNVTLAMAQELIRELEAGNSGQGRIHIVVVNRAQSNVQTPWHEVEQTLGQEIRAIISAAPDLAFQAARVAMPIVMYQSNAVVSSQLIKLSEDLNTRIRTVAGGELMT
jgi:pilus assembly protein CpaE